MSETFADPEELLLRQAHPSWVQDGKVTSQLFKPTSKDQGGVSVDRESMITAEKALLAHRDQDLKSVGVYAVTVAEVGDDAGLSLDHDKVGRPSHASIVMTDLTRSQQNSRAGLLRERAAARGLCFPENGQHDFGPEADLA